MKLAVISPPEDRRDEMTTLVTLFSAGLDRYHLRKPRWTRERVEAWLASLPAHDRRRVFVHGHPELAARFRLGGVHFPDAGADRAHAGYSTSRSCHDVRALKARLGHYDALFFGPVFSSLSKPGYGPLPVAVLDEARSILLGRNETERRTRVFAIGGITAERLASCPVMGFDGAAVLGAVWAAADPVTAFTDLARAKGTTITTHPSVETQP